MGLRNRERIHSDILRVSGNLNLLIEELFNDLKDALENTDSGFYNKIEDFETKLEDLGRLKDKSNELIEEINIIEP